MEAGDHFKNGASSKSQMSRIIVKKIFHVLIAVLCVTRLSLAQEQEITKENYHKTLALFQEELSQEFAKISASENVDSIMNAFEKIVADLHKKTANTLIKFAAAFEVSEFLDMLFHYRFEIPKDTIRSILKNIPENMQSSPYAKSLLYHIETEQIIEGSKYYDFQANDTDGKNFTLSSLEGENILFIYGGLDCMGEQGRDGLSIINSENSNNNLKIVVFCRVASNFESMQQLRTKHQQSLPFDFYYVSDYLSDHSTTNIMYAPKAYPTTFLINKNGLVVMRATGFNHEQVQQYIKQL